MLRSLEHRGPDDWGMAFFGLDADLRMGDGAHVIQRAALDLGLAMGHRRLSILDLTADGRQPMSSPDGLCTITFNGEIYNYIELREELRQAGAGFRTHCDTEVLLEAYRHWGTDMLPRLDGMYSFALWDVSRKRLICARDPFGIKPFYYGRDSNRYVFASEQRAVLEGLGSKGHMDRSRIAEFLVAGIADYDHGTHYEEIQQLGPGECIEVDARGKVTKRHVFWAAPSVPNEQQPNAVVLVQDAIDNAVARQLRSDVPIGACLSAGLDSGAIVAAVSRQLGPGARDFKVLTLSSPGFGPDETVVARTLASQLGLDWHPVTIDLSTLPEELEQHLRMTNGPTLGLSMFAGFKVMQKAQELGLKVMLNGQGGDEVFLGYPRMARRVLGEYWREGSVFKMAQEWFAMRRNMREPFLNWLIGNVYFTAGKFAVWRCRRRIRSFVDADLLSETRDDLTNDFFGSDGCHQAQVADLVQYSLQPLLRFEDRNSMAHGIEMRLPLLSVPLVNTSLQLPIDWRVRDGWTKYALRMAMNGQLPNDIVWNRRKLGFEVPAARWISAMRPSLNHWLSGLPSDSPVQAESLLAEIDAGGGDSQWFWRCLSTALWISFSGVKV